MFILILIINILFNKTIVNANDQKKYFMDFSFSNTGSTLDTSVQEDDLWLLKCLRVHRYKSFDYKIYVAT